MFVWGLLILILAFFLFCYFILNQSTILFIRDFVNWLQPHPNLLIKGETQRHSDEEDLSFSTMPVRKCSRNFQSSISESRYSFVKRKNNYQLPQTDFLSAIQHFQNHEETQNAPFKNTLPQSETNISRYSESGFNYSNPQPFPKHAPQSAPAFVSKQAENISPVIENDVKFEGKIDFDSPTKEFIRKREEENKKKINNENGRYFHDNSHKSYNDKKNRNFNRNNQKFNNQEQSQDNEQRELSPELPKRNYQNRNTYRSYKDRNQNGRQ
ncbi:hypothetical protein TRFO_21841 [Tritrichomonas foetus]|uniref:Uncharacterized protein n=1 Tax=Tritrichomonas foetus TaxID=1144522 RepID=A0A1J4KCX4_9EUKA|nr:hypothetical protein TRFO_21841 [Tritrichomonas foetus]|eukprot:OHT09279.1 hypothetical protein TRFO_21841 [Tritrichomonas foetus]